MALCSDIISIEGKGAIPQPASLSILEGVVTQRAELCQHKVLCTPAKHCNPSSGIVWPCRCREQRYFVWELAVLAVSY